HRPIGRGGKLTVWLWRFPDRLDGIKLDGERSGNPEQSKGAPRCAPKRARLSASSAPNTPQGAPSAPIERTAVRVEHAPPCAPLACARDTALTNYELRDEDDPPVAPQGEIPETIRQLPPKLRGRMEQVYRQATADPPKELPRLTPRMDAWQAPYTAGVPTLGHVARALKAEAMAHLVAIQGPNPEAAVDAMLLFLACALGDTKPESANCWRRHIIPIAATPEGRTWIVDLLELARGMEKPPRYFSKSLAWGPDGAEKTGHRVHLPKRPGDRPQGSFPHSPHYARAINPCQ
ncbi:MAG TPA: hypothetical protein VKS25_04255, partial [Solirubrobacteraceae bacterium]|nr:hypothetical protein [Solirubrobacteraceae bacterium]